jgi:hypothetical protein
LLDFTSHDGEHGFLERFFHSHARVRDNTDGGILQQMTRAGFAHSAKLKEDKMLFGLMQTGYYRAQA